MLRSTISPSRNSQSGPSKLVRKYSSTFISTFVLIAHLTRIMTPKVGRVRLSQSRVVGFHEKAGGCQVNSFIACHSLVAEESPHRGRAQSRPSVASQRVAWTGGRDAISSETREWQAASAQLPLSKGPRPIAPLPFALFFSHDGLCASWGPQISR